MDFDLFDKKMRVFEDSPVCGGGEKSYSFSTISPMYSKSSSFPCAFSAEV